MNTINDLRLNNMTYFHIILIDKGNQKNLSILFLFVPHILKINDETLSLEIRSATADRIITKHGCDGY